MWTVGEAVPLEKLLRPPDGAVPDSIRQLTHEACLAGWTEQPSPCCGAASIAGALNALRKLDGGGASSKPSEGAAKPMDVLPILQDLIHADLVEKRAQLARALNLPGAKGTFPLALLMTCVETLQAKRGRPLTGRKEAAVTPKELRASLREIANQASADPDSRAKHPTVSPEDEAALWSRLRWGGEASGGEGRAEPEEELCFAPPAAAPAAAEGTPLREEAALVKLAQAHAGWIKITLPSAPSTAAVGNTHILSATSTISTKLGLRVLCKKMCGSRDKAAARADKPCDDLDWKLSEDDDTNTVELQWHRLWRAFDDPDSVLLVHCE